MKVKLVGKNFKIEEVDYDEKRDKPSTEEVKSIMINALKTCNENLVCEKASKTIDDIYLVKFPDDINRKEIVICIREMTPGGRKALKDEQRIQPQSQQINYIYNKIQEGKLAVLLGAYERDGEIVLSAWKAKYSNAATPTTGISKQVKLDPIVNAMKNGFSQYKNSKGEFVCVFRPEYIFLYIYNSLWIHDETLEKSSQYDNNSINTLPEELREKYDSIIIGNGKTIKDIRESINKNSKNNELENKVKKEALDIEALLAKISKLEETEKQTIVKTRIGQGIFKDLLIDKYNGKCCICGLECKSLLIGSHIKDWAKSNENEKLDVNNGLLLCSKHDALFDKYLISFNDNGKIIISDKLSNNDKKILGLSTDIEIEVNDEMKKYLDWHRKLLK